MRAGAYAELVHVAALPFPTHQGTQASIDAMLRAHAAAGERARLICYHGRAFDRDAPYPIDRVRDFPRDRSVRSGPSLRKLALDAQLAMHLWRTTSARSTGRVLVAHHVEAALAAVLSGARPTVFVAHTVLGPELPSYIPRALPRPLRERAVTPALERSGTGLERFLARAADRVLAISPAIAETLSRVSGVPVAYVPVPWAPSSLATREERESARRVLGVDSEARLVLYAGNLDRYQGWERVVDAAALLRAEHRPVALLLHSASDPEPFVARAGERGLDRATFVLPMRGELERTIAHAAADVVAVTREAPGGLPIKLLDALARGCRVVVERRATAGLAIDDAAIVVDGSGPRALSLAIREVIESESLGDRLHAERARRYLTDHHSEENYRAALRASLPKRG